jgi:O-antigen ligase
VPQVQLLLVIVVLYFLSDTLNAPDAEKVNLLGAGFYFAEGLRIFINRVAFTLFFIMFIRTPRNVRMIYMLALAFMMITALSGVQNVLAGGGLKGYRAFTGATELVAGQVGVIRAAGNPNRLAMFAVLAIGGLWYLMQSIRSVTARIVIVPILVTLALAVFLTASRSGLVGLVLCTGVIVLDGGFDVRKIFTVILAGLLLAVVAVQFVPERNLERILNLPGRESADVGEGEASLERRQYSYELAWDLFKENPVLGVGMGNWAVVRFIRDPGRSAGSPHNSFLLALVEGGPLVLILFGFTPGGTYEWRSTTSACRTFRSPI